MTSVCLLCLAMAGPLLAQGPSDASLVRSVVPSQDSTKMIEAELNPVVYGDLLERRRIVLDRFPLPGARTVDLQLARFDVLARDARFVVVDDQGEREVARSGFRSFRGHVRGDPDSSVTLSAFGGRLAGSIRTHDGEFVVAPDPTGIRVWNRTVDPDRPDQPFCSAELPSGDGIALRSPPPALAIDENTLLTAQVAIDAPYEWYEHFGALTPAQDYILNVMAQVATIYRDEVNIDLEVPFLRVFTVPGDPYSDTTDTSTLLAELRAEWNANQTGVDRTVAHLFGVRPSGGSGIAYLNVLCSNEIRPGNSYDYGVSTLSARGGSWEKNLVAHELGHNFSSPHTHCYVPEIDQCANEVGCYSGTTVATTGTIMSYCSSKISEFHPRVEVETIRPAAEAAYPTCLTAPDDVPDPPQNLRVE